MNGISASFEENQEAWLSLSLSTTQPQPQPPAPAPAHPIQPMPLEAPMHPFSSPQEPHQEMFFAAPPYPRPPSQLNDMPELIPECFFPSQKDQDQEAGPSRQARARRLPVRATREGKSETITAPYPWATSRRATVYSLEYLLSKGINRISGTVQCKRCERQYEIEYDLQEKFFEVAEFIAEKKCTMHDRAPSVWMNPVLPNCKFCGQENCIKPVIDKKKATNWLFLLLGQMLGCCKLAHLKYFCKHTKNHRTGAKDRVLYLTYLGLCKQLNPKGPFNV